MFPYPGNRDDYLWNTYPYWYVFPYHTTHITRCMCSLFRETHIPSDMRSPTRGTHISGYMFSRNAMCSPFPLPRKHISLVIQCMYTYLWYHCHMWSPVIRVPPNTLCLVTCVSWVGKHTDAMITDNMCSPTRETHITSDTCIFLAFLAVSVWF